jgi:hypothetical protein
MQADTAGKSDRAEGRADSELDCNQFVTDFGGTRNKLYGIGDVPNCFDDLPRIWLAIVDVYPVPRTPFFWFCGRELGSALRWQPEPTN